MAYPDHYPDFCFLLLQIKVNRRSFAVRDWLLEHPDKEPDLVDCVAEQLVQDIGKKWSVPKRDAAIFSPEVFCGVNLPAGLTGWGDSALCHEAALILSAHLRLLMGLVEDYQIQLSDKCIKEKYPRYDAWFVAAVDKALERAAQPRPEQENPDWETVGGGLDVKLPEEKGRAWRREAERYAAECPICAELWAAREDSIQN